MTDSIQNQFDQLEILFKQNQLHLDTHINNLTDIKQNLPKLDLNFQDVNNALTQLLTNFINKTGHANQDSLTELRNSIADDSNSVHFHRIIDAIQDLNVSDEFMLQLNRTIQVLRE
ncbi:hypothetical protein JA1_004293 [Spathaspora sp. JA1]|nr:hypothetical protein JA1_004293 [Spathaspora sp. JA1]